MTYTVNLRKKRRRGWREAVVIVIAVVLTTAGIKASDLFFGSDETAVMSNGSDCPDGMIRVPFGGGDFCIDQFEASAAEDCPYDDPVSQSATRDNLDTDGCLPVSMGGKIPWRSISQDQAVLACAKAGKRLPTNEEWYAAALGTPDKAGSWEEYDCQVANNWTEQPGRTGSGARCQSSAGAYDMIGNVWEWVAGAVYDGKYDGKTLPESGYIQGTDGASLPLETDPNTPNDNYFRDYFWIKDSGARAIARGGYWGNESEAGQYSLYVVSPPADVGKGIGFRCVK